MDSRTAGTAAAIYVFGGLEKLYEAEEYISLQILHEFIPWRLIMVQLLRQVSDHSKVDWKSSCASGRYFTNHSSREL